MKPSIPNNPAVVARRMRLDENLKKCRDLVKQYTKDPKKINQRELDWDTIKKYMDAKQEMIDELQLEDVSTRDIVCRLLEVGCRYLRLEMEKGDGTGEKTFQQKIVEQTYENYLPSSLHDNEFYQEFMSQQVRLGNPTETAPQLVMWWLRELHVAELKSNPVEARLFALINACFFTGQIQYACRFADSFEKDEKGNPLNLQAVAARARHAKSKDQEFEIVRDELRKLGEMSVFKDPKWASKAQVARKISKIVLSRLHEIEIRRDYSILRVNEISKADLSAKKNGTTKTLEDYEIRLAGKFYKDKFSSLYKEYIATAFPAKPTS
uniref:Uncharacterized protein n=1 Tax=Thiomonas intermedia (strain K12) TaxID=75379 RepID=D5WYU1_THIK1